MSLTSLETRRYAAPNNLGAPKIRTIKYSVAAQQKKKYRRSSCPLNPDAVDPALLYAKLEVVKLEADTARREAREQKRRTREKMHDAAAARSSVQADKAFSSRQKELMRRSLPIDAEVTADGKPVFNTAKILAALDSDDRGQALAQTLVQRHDSGRRSKRISAEPAIADSKRPSHESDREDEDQLAKIRQGSVPRRRFKVDDTVPTKLVLTKHGSQTVYERVEVHDTGLLEDTEASEDTDHGEHSRPRLSRYDRPHWAQQSQNAPEMSLLKQAVQGTKRRAPRPLSQIPGWEEQDMLMEGGGRAGHASRNDSTTSDTLIADAVTQIKREERMRKWQSVQNFLKRPPCS